jgi:hypothetical protein
MGDVEIMNKFGVCGLCVYMQLIWCCCGDLYPTPALPLERGGS